MKHVLLSLLFVFNVSVLLNAQSPPDLSVKLTEEEALNILKEKGFPISEHSYISLDTESFDTPAWELKLAMYRYSVTILLNGDTGKLEQVSARKQLRCGTFSSEEERIQTMRWLAQEGSEFASFIEQEWVEQKVIDFSKFQL